MNRYTALVTVFAAVACGTPPGTANAPAGTAVAVRSAAVPPDATPSEVYLMFGERQLQLQTELKVAFERLEPLQADGREQELERGRTEILESANPDILSPFLSQNQLQEQEAIPVLQRRMNFVRNLNPLFTPSRIEVRNEVVSGDQAILDVRGYFEEVFTGEPGWIAGTISMVREESGWKVDSESFGSPGSGEDDAPSGHFDFGGGLPIVDESPIVTHPMWESYGGGWSFAVRDKGYVVRFNNIPSELLAGEFPLATRPAIPGDADPATLRFPLSVSFARRSESGGYDKSWDESVTGTLTVEAVEKGKVSGRFTFSAEPAAGDPVTVQGSFQNVKLLEALEPGPSVRED